VTLGRGWRTVSEGRPAGKVASEAQSGRRRWEASSTEAEGKLEEDREHSQCLFALSCDGP
jgi:hypothetical protein